jgi:hypothetical protein
MLAPDGRIYSAGCTVLIAPALFLCALLCRPDLCADAWMARNLGGALPAEERSRLGELEQIEAHARRSLEGKVAVAQDLAAGRLSLPEAAARCRDLDRQNPGFNWEEFRRTTPGASDEERHCREAIRLLRTNLPLGHSATEELARRLAAALQADLERGTLRLPGAEGPDGSPTP